MAWTTPRTWTIAEFVTKAILDTHIRDNLREVWHEIAFSQSTSVASITAATEGAADTVLGPTSSVSLDGSTDIYVEFSAPKGTGSSLRLVLFEDSTAKGIISEQAADAPISVRRKLTPATGSHTYTVKAYCTAGTGAVTGGAGGSGQYAPMTLRVWQKG